MSATSPNRNMPMTTIQSEALVSAMFVQSYRLLLSVERLDSTKDSV